MKTVVTFRSDAFNTTEPQEYFINPGCFGDDVAKWLMGQLDAQGVKITGEPSQEDFGWYFTFRVENVKHAFVLGLRHDDATWIGWVERHRGLMGSMILGRKRGIRPAALRAVHVVLSGSPQIHDVRWHDQVDFDAGREDMASPEP
jgi:hypothetical protein